MPASSIRTLLLYLFCASGLLVVATHVFWPRFWLSGKETHYHSSILKFNDGDKRYSALKNELINKRLNELHLLDAHGESLSTSWQALHNNDSSEHFRSSDEGTAASEIGEKVSLNPPLGFEETGKEVVRSSEGSMNPKQGNINNVFTTALLINQQTNIPNDKGRVSSVHGYSNPGNQQQNISTRRKGKEEENPKFNVSVSDEEGKQKPDAGFHLKEYLYEHLVCLTAISDNHFREAHDLFTSVNRCLPDKKIIVYDLGLHTRNRDQLIKFPNVELRPFPFDDYLPYMRNLRTYAWKPVIVNLVAQEYDVIMYGDASLRMVSCDMSSALEHLLKFPILNANPIVYRAIEFTHDGMMEYLQYPKARIDMAGIQTLEASGWLMWANSVLKEKVIEPWWDCALHQDCIAPEGAQLWPCEFTSKHDGHYVGCHRYDQSAMLVILAREFGLDFESKASNRTISNRLWAIRKY